MNEQEQERYESELRRIPPARLPEPLLARLRAAKPVAELAQPALRPPRLTRPGWWRSWRWLSPAMGLAMGVVALVVWRANHRPASRAEQKPTAIAYGLKADDVRVDEELVSSYEVVAKLPSGEEVRFRCRKYRDQWMVTDTNRGVEIVQNNPRVEVVPVRFETY